MCASISKRGLEILAANGNENAKRFLDTSFESWEKGSVHGGVEGVDSYELRRLAVEAEEREGERVRELVTA